MSQRGPAPRPTSRRSPGSSSPSADGQLSPFSTKQHQGSGPELGPRDVRDETTSGGGSGLRGGGGSSGGESDRSPLIPYTNGEDRAQQIPPRTLGVQSLIHPTEPRHPTTTGATPLSGARPPPSESMAVGPAQYGAPPPGGPRPYPYQGPPPPPALPRHGTPGPSPGGMSTGLRLSPPDRGSPTSSVPPLPALNNPRSILSPKPPRASSLSRAPPRGTEPQQPPFLQGAGPTRKRSFAEIGSASEGPPHYGPVPPPFGTPPAPPSLGGMTPPTRSLSQPALMMHHPQTSQEPLPPLPPGIGRDAQGRPALLPAQASFVPSLPPGYSPSMRPDDLGPGPMGGSGLFRTAGGKTVVGGQHMIQISPAFGEKIMVPVDMHQASKSMDEKRQRNAGASARFRQRKKEKEQERDKEIQKLQDEKRELQIKMQALQSQRDFYRDERNRLRDVVARTPQISDHALQAPPSPTSSRSGGSFAEHSPLVAGPHHPQQQQVGGSGLSHEYASSETSSIERPTRRRRTDPHPEFNIPSYGPQLPPATSLPPMPPMPPMSAAAPPYGATPPRPPAMIPLPPGAGGPEPRLPPMRTEAQPGMGGPPIDPALASLGSGSGPTYPSYTRVPYESGWANNPNIPPGPPSGPPPPPENGRR